jgi:hypothetical protein
MNNLAFSRFFAFQPTTYHCGINAANCVTAPTGS